MLLPRRPDVFPRDHEVVELDNVHRILRPTIRDVALHREGVGFQRFRFAPTDPLPMPP